MAAVLGANTGSVEMPSAGGGCFFLCDRERAAVGEKVRANEADGDRVDVELMLYSADCDLALGEDNDCVAAAAATAAAAVPVAAKGAAAAAAVLPAFDCFALEVMMWLTSHMWS